MKPGSSKDGHISMTERAAISKYTLVPVTVVIASMAMTAGFMQWVGFERERLLLLETKVEAMEKYMPMIHQIRMDVALIKQHLQIQPNQKIVHAVAKE